MPIDPRFKAYDQSRSTLVSLEQVLEGTVQAKLKSLEALLI